MRDRFLVGAAVGSGIVGLAAERGGADFLLAINAGRMRNMGAPSVAGMLPIRDARALTEEFAVTEVLNQCSVPVLLGVDCWGETADPGEVAARVRDLGFAGAVNFPTAMYYPPAFQRLLERAGRGIAREVEVLARVQALGLTSLFYCANRTQARLGADAGLDMILLNLGWNQGGAFGHRPRRTLEEVGFAAAEIGRLVKRIHPGVRFLLEGGPIVTAEDLGTVIARAPVDGYVGGSTIERLPLEVSISERIAAYRSAGRHHRDRTEAEAKLLAWGRRRGFAGRSDVLVGFLGRLRTIAESGSTVLLLHESGGNLGPVERALARQADSVTRVVAEPGDAGAAEARRLFGEARDGAAPRRGALAAPGLVIVEAPDRLPRAVQRRLARAISDGAVRPPGTRQARPVAARCLFVMTLAAGEDPGAALDPRLTELLGPWRLEMPPLRARAEDMSEIVEAMLAADGVPEARRPRLTRAATARLVAHDWPDNERELRALVARLVLEAGGRDVGPHAVARLIGRQPAPPAVDRSESVRIAEALWRNGYSRTLTAEALGISRKTLYNKIRKFGLGG